MEEVRVVTNEDLKKYNPMVEKYMREARALGLALGGLDGAREEAGRALCETPERVELSYMEAP